MVYHVVVAFGKDREYTYRFTDSDLARQTAEEARRWFDREFLDLECEVSTRVGKVLVIDKILNVAKCGGEARFAERKQWAEEFAHNAALVLGRDTIRVDLASYSLGY